MMLMGISLDTDFKGKQGACLGQGEDEWSYVISVIVKIT